MSKKRAFTIVEAAEAYGVSTATIRRAINTGELPAKRLGSVSNGKRLIALRDLEEWFERLPDA